MRWSLRFDFDGREVCLGEYQFSKAPTRSLRSDFDCFAIAVTGEQAAPFNPPTQPHRVLAATPLAFEVSKKPRTPRPSQPIPSVVSLSRSSIGRRFCSLRCADMRLPCHSFTPEDALRLPCPRSLHSRGFRSRRPRAISTETTRTRCPRRPASTRHLRSQWYAIPTNRYGRVHQQPEDFTSEGCWQARGTTERMRRSRLGRMWPSRCGAVAVSLTSVLAVTAISTSQRGLSRTSSRRC